MRETGQSTPAHGTAPEAGRTRWRVWLATARPPTLTASVGPVLVGSALAAWDGVFHPGVFALTLTASVLLQASVNYLNEYFDWKYGLDTPESLGVKSELICKLASLVGPGIHMGWSIGASWLNSAC
ncbi:MAG: hypothetical protein KGO05_05560 [Chloroflexota bacterium]|nr:hypothetical protein [Chloroflexota bacterium]